MMEDNLFARLEKLFDVTLLADSSVLVLGLWIRRRERCTTARYVRRKKVYTSRP